MNSRETLLATFEPLPAWLYFMAIAIGIIAVAVGALLWLVLARKKRKRKYRRHQHEQRKLNPTLAQSGGLPPVREEKKSAAPAPPS
jgi:uncharacterized membrane protein